MIGRAEAGDRALEVTLVNMTPDALSSDASRACLRTIDSKLPRGENWDRYSVERRGESALRKQVSMTHGEPFLSWSAATIAAVPNVRDALILVDCRPADGQLDILVRPASGAIVRVAVRRKGLSPAVIAWAMEEVLVRAWAGWVP